MLITEQTVESGPITLRWYAWGGLDPFFYQVNLGAESRISFFYEGKQRESRTLSAFERKYILGLLGKLRLPVAESGRGRTVILPTVGTRITVEGDGFQLSVTWTNSDAEEMSAVYRPMEDLCKAIRAMLEIDTKGLELPVYM